MKLDRLTVIFGMILISGCAYLNPLIQTANFVPLDQEKTLGVQVASEVAKSTTIVEDPRFVNRARIIGNRLVSVLPKKDYDYKFYVVADNTLNAFTIPGGSIYVHSGLMQIADDAELAGVIGHEIGHAYHRHPTRAITRQYGIQYISSLLFKGNQNQIKALAIQFGQTAILSKYGREEEFEADDVGYQLTKRAGYSAEGIVRFFRKLQLAEKSGGMPMFLRSHPPTAERIARLEALSKQ